jgi:hypothetical protein
MYGDKLYFSQPSNPSKEYQAYVAEIIKQNSVPTEEVISIITSNLFRILIVDLGHSPIRITLFQYLDQKYGL